MTYTFVIAGRQRKTMYKYLKVTNNTLCHQLYAYVTSGFGLHRIFGLVYKIIRLGGGRFSTAQTVKVTVFRDVMPCSLVYPRLLKCVAIYYGIASSSGM